MRDGCCGNGVCEAGENGNTCSQDCTFALSTPTCSQCWVPYGAQFDVQATINDIDISKILFGIYQGNTNIKLYTSSGSYNNTEAGDWTLIASGSLVISNWATIVADIGGITVPAGSTRSFYITATGGLTVAEDSNTPLASDENLLLLNPTQISWDSSEFGYMSSGSYGWVGGMEYSVNGGTIAPSRNPTKAPSRAPTISCESIASETECLTNNCLWRPYLGICKPRLSKTTKTAKRI